MNDADIIAIPVATGGAAPAPAIRSDAMLPDREGDARTTIGGAGSRVPDGSWTSPRDASERHAVMARMGGEVSKQIERLVGLHARIVERASAIEPECDGGDDVADGGADGVDDNVVPIRDGKSEKAKKKPPQKPKFAVVMGMPATPLSPLDADGRERARKLAYRIGGFVAAGMIDAIPATVLVWMLAVRCGEFDRVASKCVKSGVAGSENGDVARASVHRWLIDLRNASLPLTDLGNAERFVARAGADFRYTTAKGWLGWDGRRWRESDQEKDKVPAEVKAGVFATVRGIQDEAAAIAATGVRGDDNPFGRDRWVQTGVKKWDLFSDILRKHGRSSESSGKIAAIPALAERWLTVPVEAFDIEPLAVNCENGTLRIIRRADDAPDGTPPVMVSLDPHRRADLITKLAPVTYDPAAPAPLYDGLMEWAQPDAAVRRYLHAWGGYSATGETGEQQMQFWYGLGANGKSTVIDAWADTLGDYAGTIGIETFLDQGVKKRGDAATPDLARLAGVRLLRASEPERGARLNEALIKSATGGEPMAVRALHKGFFDLRPQFKLTIGGNHRPDVPGTDEGIWRRLKLIPWDAFRAENERDRNLGQKLKRERDGIFARLVAGMVDWAENGLVEPETVTEATAAYRDDSDPLARFLRRCTVREVGARVQSSQLHAVFAAWATAAQESVWSNKGFAKAMLAKGYRKKASDGMQWLDLRLTAEVGDFVDSDGKPRPLDDDGGLLGGSGAIDEGALAGGGEVPWDADDPGPDPLGW